MADEMQPGSSPAPQQKGSGWIVYVILAILVIGGIVVYAATRDQAEESGETMTTEQPSTQSSNNPPANTSTPATTTTGQKTFTVEAANFSFSLKEIRVKKGDTVKIVFNNKEGFHDWVLDEFNVRTPQIAANKSEEVEFVADKIGTFEYYCSVGQHRQMGMKGNLIVEE